MPDSDLPYGYPEVLTPTGTVIDGFIALEGSALAEALRRIEGDEAWIAPSLGVGFVEPWKITKSADGPAQDH